MSGLVDYLRARLDEEEDAAKRAAFGWGAEWTARDASEGDCPWAVVDAAGKRDAVVSEDLDVIQHCAIHDPARVLADIAAKRAALDHAQRRCAAADNSNDPADHLVAGGALEVMERLAQVYADRDDFDPTWRL